MKVERSSLGQTYDFTYGVHVQKKSILHNMYARNITSAIHLILNVCDNETSCLLHKVIVFTHYFFKVSVFEPSSLLPSLSKRNLSSNTN